VLSKQGIQLKGAVLVLWVLGSLHLPSPRSFTYSFGLEDPLYTTKKTKISEGKREIPL